MNMSPGDLGRKSPGDLGRKWPGPVASSGVWELKGETECSVVSEPSSEAVCRSDLAAKGLCRCFVARCR